MNSILFGAGASFGSGPTHPHQAPLGGGVEGALAKAFGPIWQQVPEAHRKGLANDFESEMEKILNSGTTLALNVGRLAGLLFASFLPLPGNAYMALARFLDEEKLLDDTVVATLNYDCMWEVAVVTATGRPISYFGDTGSTVLKPHGSCNWLLQGVTGPPGSVAFNPATAPVEGGIEAIDPRHVPTRLANHPFPPIMAYYARNKHVSVCSTHIKKIQERWDEAAKASNRTVVAGVHPNDYDTHVFEALVNSDSEILVVSPTVDAAAWEAIGIDANRVSTHAAGFADSVETIQNFLTG